MARGSLPPAPSRRPMMRAMFLVASSSSPPGRDSVNGLALLPREGASRKCTSPSASSSSSSSSSSP
eukprot:9410828-Pyramimonas_sp.AAC.1